MNPKPGVPELTDQIYNALLGDGSWQHFLDLVRRLLPNGQAYLFYHDASSGSGAFPLSAGTDDALIAAYNKHYSTLNPWMPHAALRPLGRVMQADSMLRRTDLARTEFYNDYLKPQDIHTGLGVTIERDGGINFLFSVLCANTKEREMQRAVARLQALVPTLRDAFMHYRRAGSLAAAPGRGPASRRGSVIRIGPNRRVLDADGAAARSAESYGLLSIRPFGRFVCQSEALLAHIDEVLAAWGKRAGAPAARVFHLFRDNGETPLRVTAFRPVETGDVSYFRGPECVLVIDDPAQGLAPAVDEFATRFGLTPAERRLVLDMIGGMAIEDIAVHRGISRNTIKTQLKQIFAKANLARQSELIRHVALMAGGHPPETLFEAAGAARTFEVPRAPVPSIPRRRRH